MMKFLGLKVLTSKTMILPKRLPKSTSSPGLAPETGTSLTPRALQFIMPIESTSAIIPAMMSIGVLPGMHIMSRPVEHIEHEATRDHSVADPCFIASHKPKSSLLGSIMPLNPPISVAAMTPALLKASVSNINAHDEQQA